MQTQNTSPMSKIEPTLAKGTFQRSTENQILPKLENNVSTQKNTEKEKEKEKEKERRLAPRSSNQFRVGPPFSSTVPGFSIYMSGQTKPVVPKICARLDRGFDMIEGEWIGYKRNYFTLVASFQFIGIPLDVASGNSFQYSDSVGIPHNIEAFKISLTSVCLEDNATAVTLVQHTAKRDRGPQSSPPLYFAVPGELPPHSTMKSVANIRNGDKIDKCNRLFYLSKDERKKAISQNPQSILSTYPENCDISLVARYERIQFSSAGCGNRKSASTNNKHYILVVQLLGMTESGTDVTLASTQSPPLIVRGRSPSNYPVASKKDSKEAKIFRATQSMTGQASLENTETPETEDGTGTENRTMQKKRKTKAGGASLHCLPLGESTNIGIPYTESMNPGVFDYQMQRKSRIKPQRVSSHYNPTEYIDHGLMADLRSDLRTNLREDMGYPSFYNIAPLCQDHRLVIAQDHSFPFIADSPSALSRDGPMNINHTEFQSSPDRFHHAAHEYDREMIELEDVFDSEVMGSYDIYSALPNPIVFPDPVRTSTPLELQVKERPALMQPSLLRNLHPTIVRCKHGFKQRDHPKPQKRYTYADLNDDRTWDPNFINFMNKLASYKQVIRDTQPMGTPSTHSSSLTMIDSDQDTMLLNGLVEPEREDCQP